MSRRAVFWNSRSTIRWTPLWLGALLAAGPGVATAASPVAVTGSTFAGGHAVKCIGTEPNRVNVDKFPPFGDSKPSSSVSSTVQTGDQDNWCDGSSNKEAAFALAALEFPQIYVDSRIDSVREKAITFGVPVAPFVTSGATLSASVSFGFNPASPPRPGFAYMKVYTQATVTPNGPPCGDAGDVIPCREVRFKIGSEFNRAVNRRTVPVDEDIFSANQSVSYYIALKLQVPGVNVIDVPMLLLATVSGNGHADGFAALGKVEKPRGWTFLTPPPPLQPAAQVAPPDFPPVAVVDAGQAEPAPQGSVLISPPSGTLVPGQGFDLVLVVQTAGQTIAGLTGSFDGLDVSGALAGCGQGTLTGGTPGDVIRCPGLSAGLLGPGTHTLHVSVTLSGGATLTDSATWTVLGGAVGAAPGPGPSVEVTPPPGVYTETQGFDLGLVLDLQGRTVVNAALTFDEVDVTGPLVACSSIGSVPTGQVTLRCPGLSGGLLGPGTHFFHVVLDLDDGSQLVDGAVWEVLSAAGA